MRSSISEVEVEKRELALALRLERLEAQEAELLARENAVARKERIVAEREWAFRSKMDVPKGEMARVFEALGVVNDVDDAVLDIMDGALEGVEEKEKEKEKEESDKENVKPAFEDEDMDTARGKGSGEDKKAAAPAAAEAETMEEEDEVALLNARMAEIKARLAVIAPDDATPDAAAASAADDAAVAANPTIEPEEEASEAEEVDEEAASAAAIAEDLREHERVMRLNAQLAGVTRMLNEVCADVTRMNTNGVIGSSDGGSDGGGGGGAAVAVVAAEKRGNEQEGTAAAASALATSTTPPPTTTTGGSSATEKLKAKMMLQPFTQYCRSVDKFKAARAWLRENGGASVVLDAMRADGFVEPKTHNLNLTVVSAAPGVVSPDQFALGAHADEFVVRHNDPEHDANWSDERRASTASMAGPDPTAEGGSPGHVFIGCKDLRWDRFNVLVMGMEGASSSGDKGGSILSGADALRDAAGFLGRLKAAADHYVGARRWNPATTGMYFHVFPLDSVDGGGLRALHVVNIARKGPALKYNAHKNMALDAVMQVFAEELDSLPPLPQTSTPIPPPALEQPTQAKTEPEVDHPEAEPEAAPAVDAEDGTQVSEGAAKNTLEGEGETNEENENPPAAAREAGDKEEKKEEGNDDEAAAAEEETKDEKEKKKEKESVSASDDEAASAAVDAAVEDMVQGEEDEEAINATLDEMLESEEDEEAVNTTLDGMLESEEEGEAVDEVVNDVVEGAEP